MRYHFMWGPSLDTADGRHEVTGTFLPLTAGLVCEVGPRARSPGMSVPARSTEDRAGLATVPLVALTSEVLQE
jgi:hypothetical protein